MQKEQLSYKQFFINYGIFVTFLLVIFGILIYTIIVSKKTWQTALKQNIEIVLDENDTDTWNLGKSININNPFILSAAAFEARNRTNGELYTAIIIRIQTFCGPMPAVFIMNSENDVKFIGYSSLHGRFSKLLSDSETDHRIKYWSKKIPEIISLERK